MCTKEASERLHIIQTLVVSSSCHNFLNNRDVYSLLVLYDVGEFITKFVPSLEDGEGPGTVYKSLIIFTLKFDELR